MDNTLRRTLVGSSIEVKRKLKLDGKIDKVAEARKVKECEDFVATFKTPFAKALVISALCSFPKIEITPLNRAMVIIRDRTKLSAKERNVAVWIDTITQSNFRKLDKESGKNLIYEIEEVVTSENFSSILYLVRLVLMIFDLPISTVKSLAFTQEQEEYLSSTKSFELYKYKG